MGKTFKNLTEEDMCNLMCGTSEEELVLEKHEKEFLSTIFHMMDHFFLYMEDDCPYCFDYAPFNRDDLLYLAKKLGIDY